MSAPIPPGWQWTTTITGREQLERVASKFAFDVPQTDEYAQAMAAVVERYWSSRRFGSIGQVKEAERDTE